MKNQDILQTLNSGQALPETQALTTKSDFKILNKKTFFSLLNKKLKQSGLERPNGKIFIPVSALRGLKRRASESIPPDLKTPQKILKKEDLKSAEADNKVYGGFFSFASVPHLGKTNLKQFMAGIKSSLLPRASGADKPRLRAFLKSSSTVHKTAFLIFKAVNKLSGKNPFKTIVLPGGEQVKIRIGKQSIEVLAPVEVKPVLDKALKALQTILGPENISKAVTPNSTANKQNIIDIAQGKTVENEPISGHVPVLKNKAAEALTNTFGAQFAPTPSDVKSTVNNPATKNIVPKSRMKNTATRKAMHHPLSVERPHQEQKVSPANSQSRDNVSSGGRHDVRKAPSMPGVKTAVIKKDPMAKNIDTAPSVLKKEAKDAASGLIGKNANIKKHPSSGNGTHLVSKSKDVAAAVIRNEVQNTPVKIDGQAAKTLKYPSMASSVKSQATQPKNLNETGSKLKVNKSQDGHRIFQIKAIYASPETPVQRVEGSTGENISRINNRAAHIPHNLKNGDGSDKSSTNLLSTEPQQKGKTIHQPLKTAPVETVRQQPGAERPLVHDWLKESETISTENPSWTSAKGKKTKTQIEPRVLHSNSKIVETVTPPVSIKTTPGLDVFKSSLRPVQNIQDVIEQYLKLKPGKFRANSMRIESGTLGELEVRFKDKGASRHMTIVVESEAAKAEIQKLLPAIQSGLVEKGFLFQQVNVDLGQAGAKQFKRENEKHRSSKQTNATNMEEIDDTLPTINQQKKFGYNTVEYVA